MKSQASVMLHVLEGLFKDASLAYPELRGSFLKDFERIALCSQKRGLAYFTLDLPNLDSLLLEGLECGRLRLLGPCSSRVSKRILVPKLFSGLWLRVFEKDSCLRQEADTTAVAFLRQFTCLGKRLQVECSHDRISSVIRSFFDVERELLQPTLSWAGDSLGLSRGGYHLHLGDGISAPERVRDLSRNSLQSGFFDRGNVLFDGGEDRKVLHDRDWSILDKVQQVADLFAIRLGTIAPLTYSMSLEQEGRGIGFRHGPGAVAERLGQHEKSCFPYWPAKLEGRFPYAYCGKTAGAPGNAPLNHEVPSRLICVPKTAKGPRLIAAEPVAHQWCQQLVRHWFDDRLMEEFFGSFINFRDQGLSGALVLKASRDRSLATVDLKDASDRLTCWTVERVFRLNSSLLLALHAARTRWLHQNIDASCDSFIKLKKFASQGTATTFPVQSVVFLIIALASSLGDGKVTWERIMKLRNSVRVFGDDIIIPTHGYARLVRIMDLLQLKVNVAKSYKDGHFRESCGTDGFMGDDVTPVKPKVLVADGPASCQAVIDTTNNLFNKGYWHASDRLRTTLSPRIQRGLRIVGRRDAGFAGLTCFSGSDESHLVKRWDPRLHRMQGRVLRLSEKSSQRDRQGFEPLLEFFSSVYSERNPRITSVFGRTRKVSIDLLWEPLNYGARGVTDSQRAQDHVVPRRTSLRRRLDFVEKGWCPFA